MGKDKYKLLHDLVFNPNSIGMDWLTKNIKDGKVNQNYLESALGEELARKICYNRNKQRLLVDCEPGKHPSDYSNYTQVVIWGAKNSGKTCFIGSVLAAIKHHGNRVKWTDDGLGTSTRREVLVDFFSSHDFNERLKDENNKSVVEYCVTYGVKKGGKLATYPLSFIEVKAGLTDKDWTVGRMLSHECSKIHLLCFDCSATSEKQMEQADNFCHLLNRLKENGTLAKSVGLYVVVTKCDSMVNVPLAYREMAAQSLITARFKNFWQKVQDVCYEMNILDSTPIAYSVGDVVLQDIIKPNLSAAESLLREPILLKAQPYAGLIRKLMWWGDSAVMLLAMYLGLLYVLTIGYLLFQIKTTPPDIKPEKYSFSQDFCMRIATDIANASYDNARNAYWPLFTEFRLESRIQTVSGEHLTGIYDKDLAYLANSFAQKLEKRYKELYQYRNWSKRNDDFLDAAKSGNMLFVNNQLSQTHKDSIDKFRGYFTKVAYVKALTEASRRCRSWEDVVSVNKSWSQYYCYPYTNDYDLNAALIYAKDYAYRSYGTFLLEKARGCLRKCTEARNISRQTLWGKAKGFFKDPASRYKPLANSIRHDITSVIDKVPEKERPVYQAALKTLPTIK